jgi:hypothetical protein
MASITENKLHSINNKLQIINNDLQLTSNSLQSIEKNLNIDIQNKKHEINKLILDMSLHYTNRYQDFNKSINNIFPSLNELTIKNKDIFNPSLVIEYNFKIKKPINILKKDDWNNDDGYVNNRKVMYEIELIQCWDKEVVETMENIDICNFKSFLKNSKFWREKLIKGFYRIDIRNNNFYSTLEYLGEVCKFKLEVDNYLNLNYKFYDNNECIKANIYFCFNKIIFPEFAFLSNNKLKRLVISKKNNIINNNYINKLLENNSEYKNNILDKSKSFIPENYSEVYNYFNGIRKMIKLYNKNIKTKKQEFNDISKISKILNETNNLKLQDSNNVENTNLD